MDFKQSSNSIRISTYRPCLSFHRSIENSSIPAICAVPFYFNINAISILIRFNNNGSFARLISDMGTLFTAE
jgi:hypothetical protein